MVRMTIILSILCQSDGLVPGQRPKRGTLIGQISVVKYSNGHIWQKLTNSKILKILVKWSCFLVDLTISDPLTNGQMVTIHMPCPSVLPIINYREIFLCTSIVWQSVWCCVIW